jgi:hypothetical protein
MWAGNPAKYVRDVTAEEVEDITAVSDSKRGLASDHAYEFLPVGNVYADAGK